MIYIYINKFLRKCHQILDLGRLQNHLTIHPSSVCFGWRGGPSPDHPPPPSAPHVITTTTLFFFLCLGMHMFVYVCVLCLFLVYL